MNIKREMPGKQKSLLCGSLHSKGKREIINMINEYITQYGRL